MGADQPARADRSAKASGQYLNSISRRSSRAKAGYDEAILLDEHGHVCEGTGENIFIVRDGVIRRRRRPLRSSTGSRASSVIAIARDLGFEVLERDIARAELMLADEVFFTGTAAELVPVREIDDVRVGEGHPGEVTRVLGDAFTDALHGRSERYLEWLDIVESGGAAVTEGRIMRAAG